MRLTQNIVFNVIVRYSIAREKTSSVIVVVVLLLLIIEERVPIDNKQAYRRYYSRCEFKFRVEGYILDGSYLIEQLGWFNSKTNLDGVTRDHIYSVRDGFENGVEPLILKHPVNCQIISNINNIKKGSTSSIALKQLKDRIRVFEEMAD